MMKKIFALLICLLLFISPMRLFAASAENISYISVSYNPSYQKLAVEGRDNIKKGSPVVIYLVAGCNAQPTEDNPPVVFDMIFASDGGIFQDELVVPAGTASGTYTVCVGNDARVEAYTSNIIVYHKDSLDTKNTLDALNAATTYNEFESVITNDGTNIGIDMQTEIYPAVFSEILFGVKTSVGSFTLDEFTNAVTFSRGAAVLECEKDVTKVMGNYSSAFEYTNALYEALDSNVRAKADNILLETDLYNGYVSYDKIVKVAKASLSKSYGELKDLLIGEPDAYEIDIDGKYESLSKNNKSNVFKVIFEKRDSFKSVKDISDAFDKAVSSLMSDEKDVGSSSGSDSRNHSGSSTIVGGTPIITDPVVKLPYIDIESTFAKDNIINLSKIGVISGYSDGTFKPQNHVTRAEFCKMVCVAFGFNGEVVQSFEDVSVDDWFYNYTGILFNLGILNGDGTNFYPQNHITRQDVAVILCRALAVLNRIENGTYSFEDDVEIAEYAKQSVATLASNGYFKGDGTRFYPNSYITRAETAAVIDRIYTTFN